MSRESRDGTIDSDLWGCSKQHVRQTTCPHPDRPSLPSFTLSLSSSRGRLRREDEVFVLLSESGKVAESGGGLRLTGTAWVGLPSGPPAHVRKQMTHVVALHLQHFPSTVSHTSKFPRRQNRPLAEKGWI